MTHDIFDGFGIVLSRKEIEDFLHAKFGEFEHIREVREHQHFPVSFGIDEINGLYLLGARYSSIEPNQTKLEFEHGITSALEDFLEGSGVTDKPGRLSFVFTWGEVEHV